MKLMKECEWVMNLKWLRVKFCEFWLSLREIENLGMRVLGVFFVEKKKCLVFDQ